MIEDAIHNFFHCRKFTLERQVFNDTVRVFQPLSIYLFTYLFIYLLFIDYFFYIYLLIYLFIYFPDIVLFMLLSVLLCLQLVKLTYAFVYIAMFISYCVYIECRGRVETNVVRTCDPTPLL